MTGGLVLPLRLRATAGQFVRFCLVGAAGYVVNVAVYAALLTGGTYYLTAAAVSFLIAAGNNYYWNRLWTFQTRQSRVLRQGVRAVFVSALCLAGNQLFLLVLVYAGGGYIAAQTVAVLLVTPISFGANKFWAFADGSSGIGTVSRLTLRAANELRQ